jgi:hypothetical protein
MSKTAASTRIALPLISGVGLLAAVGVTTVGAQQETTMTRLFVPVEIAADLSDLPGAERDALAHIVDAARVMDGLFLEQVWAGNPSMLLSLLNNQSATGVARLDFFLLNKGPWSRIEDNRRFVPGAPEKPPGANFYPVDATRGEIAAWFDQLEGQARREATGFFTTIRRGADGGFSIIPYSVEYQGPLAIAAEHVPSQPFGAILRVAPRRSLRTTITTVMSPGWNSTPPSNPLSAPTRYTRTSGSTTRPHSKPS